MLSRSTDASSALVAEIGKDSGRAYACDAGDPSSVAKTFAAIERDLGAPTIVFFNDRSGVWGGVEEISLEDFESAWRVNALGLLATTKAAAPAMESAGNGAIIVIGEAAQKSLLRVDGEDARPRWDPRRAHRHRRCRRHPPKARPFGEKW